MAERKKHGAAGSRKGRQTVFIQKSLQGRRQIYTVLQGCRNPYLPELYGITLSDKTTAVAAEYIEGQALDGAELSERQLRSVVREMCSVLEFQYERGVIHRDIKPSNLLLAKDGHIRRIDFYAARR